MLEALRAVDYRGRARAIGAWFLRLPRAALPFLLLVLYVVGTYRALDGLQTPSPGDVSSFYATKPEDDGPYHEGSDRVFMLMIDSLRYQNASDKKLMPKYFRLRRQSTYAEVITSNDAVTVPAMRAAFTGQDNFRVFGFVENLLRGELQVRSWLDQMQLEGHRTAVYSDGVFRQFGDAVDSRNRNKRRGIKDDLESQRAQLEEALETFASGEYDVVIFHLSYGDHVSHRTRVGSKSYKRGFKNVDKIVGEVAAAIPNHDNLFIFGDHGHNEVGLHAMGMDIPTFFLARGPGFRRDMQVDTMSITDMRYFFSWGGKVPLAPDYAGEYHPDALVPTGELPRSFEEPEVRQRDPIADRTQLAYGLLAALVGALSTLWVAVLRHGRADLGAWAIAGSAGFFIAPLGQWSFALGLAIIAYPIGREILRARHARRELAWLIAPLALAVGFQLWGQQLALWRDEVHFPSHRTMREVALYIVIASTMLAAAFGARVGAWTAMIVVGLLTYPTLYQYGTVGGMSWMWCAWLVPFLLAGFRPKNIEPGMKSGVADWIVRIMIAALIFWFIQYFGTPNTTNFKFRFWRPFVKALKPDGAKEWIQFALLCKLFIFLRLRHSPWINLFALGLIGVLTMFEYGDLPRDDKRMVTAIALLGSAAAILPKKLASSADGRAFRYVSLLGTLYLVLYYAIRLDIKTYLWTSLILAALSLSGTLVRKMRTELVWTSYVLLALLGIVGSGWVELTWAFNRLEWGLVYDWLTAQQAVDMGVFSASVTVARFFIMIWMVRTVLHERLGDRVQEPKRWILLLIGVKLISVTLVAAGLGYHLPGTNIYLEGVQYSALFLALSLGLVGWGQPMMPPKHEAQ